MIYTLFLMYTHYGIYLRTPWIVGELLKRVKYKRKLWRKHKFTRYTQDFKAHRDFSNTLSKDVNNARQSYENSIIKRGTKAVYNYTKRKLCCKAYLSILKNNSGQ